MKKCSRCKNLLNEINFSKDKSRYDGLSNRCKNCQRKLSRKHYLDNKENYRNQQRIRKLNHYDIANSIKENVGCVFCDEKRGICLDFHHEYCYDKEFNVGSGYGFPLERILNEIKKCVVICANCHRVTHSEEHKEEMLM